MFGMPRKGQIDYSVDMDLDLADVQPSVAGPKRPQDRINLPELGTKFRELLEKPVQDGGYGKKQIDLREKHAVKLNGSAPRDSAMFSTDTKDDQGIRPGEALNVLEMVANRPTPDPGKEIEAESSQVFLHGRTHIGHGSVLHKHEQPERDDCGWIIGEKSSRARSACRSWRKNVTRTGVARCFRLLGKDRTPNLPRPARIQSGRLRLHDLHWQLRAAASKHREDDPQIRSGCSFGSLRESKF
jgi:hypothetical protein